MCVSLVVNPTSGKFNGEHIAHDPRTAVAWTAEVVPRELIVVTSTT